MFCGWNRPEKAVQRIDVFVRDLAQRPERHGAIDGAAIGPLAASENCRQRLRIRVARHYAIQSLREVCRGWPRRRGAGNRAARKEFVVTALARGSDIGAMGDLVVAGEGLRRR